jgi:mercuric reductase
MKDDLIIIGGGSAAFAAALKAVEAGARSIVIVEKEAIGGTCVNRGCIPTKSLLRASEIFYYGVHSNYRGIYLQGRVSLSEIIRQKNLLVRKLRKKKYLDILKLYPQIKLIRGRAEFVRENEIRVGRKILSAERFIIATGTRPAVVPIDGIERVSYLTSSEALNLTKVPRSITIIGGRFTALEFAQIFHHFGSEVTLLQRSPRIVPAEEPEISEEMKKILIKEGIQIYTGSRVLGVERVRGKIYTTVEVDGKEKVIGSEMLMMATGVRPNSELNLEVAGVQLDQKGFVVVNEDMRTTAEHIWAAGDITGKIPLVTVAAYQGAIAGENAIRGGKKKADYSLVPHAIFTSPQIASVGLTETEATENGYKSECRVLQMEDLPRANAVHDTRGLIKMVADSDTGEVLGIHILAPNASEVIHQAVLILRQRMSLQEIVDKIDVYPTWSEMIKLCAQSYFKDVKRLSCCAE